MKRKSIIVTLLLLLALPLAAADGKKETVGIGLGIFLGSPVAFTVTANIKGPSSVECGLGFTHNDDLYLFGDYHYRIYTIPDLKELSFYIGGGIAYSHYDHDSRRHDNYYEEDCLELRVPLGMDFAIPTVPVVVTLELAPALQMVPDADLNMRGGVGVKYFF